MINIVSIGPENSIDYLTVGCYKLLQACDIGIYPGDHIGQDICDIFSGKELHKGRSLSTQAINALILESVSQNKSICFMVSGCNHPCFSYTLN